MGFNREFKDERLKLEGSIKEHQYFTVGRLPSNYKFYNTKVIKFRSLSFYEALNLSKITSGDEVSDTGEELLEQLAECLAPAIYGIDVKELLPIDFIYIGILIADFSQPEFKWEVFVKCSYENCTGEINHTLFPFNLQFDELDDKFTSPIITTLENNTYELEPLRIRDVMLIEHLKKSQSVDYDSALIALSIKKYNDELLTPEKSISLFKELDYNEVTEIIELLKPLSLSLKHIELPPCPVCSKTTMFVPNITYSRIYPRLDV